MENERRNLQRIRAASCYLLAQDGNSFQCVNAQWNVLGSLMWFLKTVNNRWLSFPQLKLSDFISLNLCFLKLYIYYHGKSLSIFHEIEVIFVSSFCSKLVFTLA